MTTEDTKYISFSLLTRGNSNFYRKCFRCNTINHICFFLDNDDITDVCVSCREEGSKQVGMITSTRSEWIATSYIASCI